MQKIGVSADLFNKIKTAKKEWETAMDFVNDLVILTDTRDKIKRCNKALSQITGKPYREILGRNWQEVLAEQGFEEGDLHIDGAEYIHKPAGRTYIVVAYPMKDSASSKFTGRVVTLHDVTQRKKMALELERKNEEIKEHRNALQDALGEVTSLIKKVVAEKKFGVYFSLPPTLETCWEKMNCRATSCPCHGLEQMRCWQVAGTHCDGKIQGVFAEKLGNCGNCQYYQKATSSPIYKIGELFNQMMFILEGKNKELEKAYDDLKASQSQLLQQEKMASIGQLAAGVAHEINNPVGFVTSNLGTLYKYMQRMVEYFTGLTEIINNAGQQETVATINSLRKKLKIDFVVEDSRELIKESLDGVERVRKIVQNLKNFSRVDQSKCVKADINQCLEETLNIVWNELKYKSTVNKEYGELPLIECYPQQLNQVFMNFLVNAAHAIDKQGEITIKTWADGGNIYAAVSDTGSGIPQENLNRLFEPFFTTKEVGKGTGLGLSIAYDIVKKHNGEIVVDSVVGKGSTFTVKIPISEGK